MPSSASDNATRLGVGSLLFAIGIALTETRMNGDWGKGVLLLVVLVPFVVTVALVNAQPATIPNNPSPLVSLLCALAFVYGLVSVVRLGAILVDSPFSGSGTATWMALLVTIIGAALTRARRSAAVGLLSLIALAVTVFVGTNWIFSYHGPSTYRYIALALALGFTFGALSVSDWPRLSSVLAVAAGLMLILIGGTLAGGLTSVTSSVTSAALPIVHATAPWGWKVVLMLGGLGLAAFAAARRDPGVGWAAAFVLILFVELAAVVQGVTVSSGATPATISDLGVQVHSASIVGWPLVFLIVGVAGVVAALTGGGGGDGGSSALTRRPEMLAGGSLLLAIGVTLTQIRMDRPWGDFALFLLVAVPFALTLWFALAQPLNDGVPSGATSLLALLALFYASDAIGRFADLLISSPFTHPGTVTWVAALATAVGVALTMSRRSAGVGLLTSLLAIGTVVAGVDWLFSIGAHLRTYEYVLVALAIGFLVVGAMRDDWPRLQTVTSVAAGFAVTLALVLVAASLVLGLVSSFGGGLGGRSVSGVAWGWMLTALVSGLVLAAIAALRREPAPAYVAGLLLLLVVALDLERSIGHSPSLVFWPLALLIAGAALAAMSLARSSPSTPGAPPPSTPDPPAPVAAG